MDLKDLRERYALRLAEMFGVNEEALAEEAARCFDIRMLSNGTRLTPQQTAMDYAVMDKLNLIYAKRGGSYKPLDLAEFQDGADRIFEELVPWQAQSLEVCC